MTYVDGYVIPVPKGKVAEYKKMATWGKKMWMKHGAVQYFECVGDDLAGMPGCGNFTTMAGLKASETVFFSFIVYKSKAHRDAVNKKVMAEMKNQPNAMPKSMPFDVKRMAFAGFKTLVQG
jgi:alkaline phosphatase